MDFTWIAGLVTAALAGIAGVIAAVYKRNQNKKDQMEHEEKLVKLGQGIANSNKILKDFTAMSKDMEYVKEGLNNLHEEVEGIKREVVEVKENCRNSDVLLLRREITNIYIKYFNPHREVCEIPERDFESALNLYDVYKSLGGNGMAEQMINEIKTWKRI